MRPNTARTSENEIYYDFIKEHNIQIIDVNNTLTICVFSYYINKIVLPITNKSHIHHINYSVGNIPNITIGDSELKAIYYHCKCFYPDLK